MGCTLQAVTANNVESRSSRYPLGVNSWALLFYSSREVNQPSVSGAACRILHTLPQTVGLVVSPHLIDGCECVVCRQTNRRLYALAVIVPFPARRSEPALYSSHGSRTSNQSLWKSLLSRVLKEGPFWECVLSSPRSQPSRAQHPGIAHTAAPLYIKLAQDDAAVFQKALPRRFASIRVLVLLFK